MIMHIVMWKFKQENKQANMDKLRDMLLALDGVVPELKHVEIGQDVQQLDGNYDMVLVTEFASTEDMQSYKVHPEHVKISKFCKSIREDRVCVDYEV